MSGVHFSIDISSEGGLQLSIGDDGGGYRICGPKYDGGGRILRRHKITARDIAEIRAYLRRAALSIGKGKV